MADHVLPLNRLDEFVEYWYRNPKTKDLDLKFIDYNDLVNLVMYAVTGDKDEYLYQDTKDYEQGN